MSLEFIKSKHNSNSLGQAVEQEKQLAYLTTSHLQENSPSDSYLRQWADRKYQTDDYFLNWIKSIFKDDNFLSFFKYLRFPLPSTKIIRNRIEPQIRRVFNAEDSAFKYSVRNRDESDYLPDLKIKDFNNQIFKKLLYRHNSILVHDLEDVNKPYRYFVDIDKVVSIEEDRVTRSIKRVAFRGQITTDEGCQKGYVYIDSERYAFYLDDKPVPVVETYHDLGYCPVFFICQERLNDDFVVRESLYTYVREEIEEYNFLKTLQKLTDANGTFPVISKLEADSDDLTSDVKENGQPNVSDSMGSATQKVHGGSIQKGDSDTNPGTIHEIPASSVMDDTGKINMDVIKNYLNFHYIPVEILGFIDKRIKELEISIVSSVVGDFLESNESSKNEDQIAKSISILENTLTAFAETLNYIRKESDYTELALKYGIDFIEEVFIHYGTDFFLESESDLFEQFGKSPNPLERKNIIVRINQNRYKNNGDAMTRIKLLYDLMPYISDADFDRAITQNVASDEDKQYYLRFNYWIGIFEATYGNIVRFYTESTGESNERLAEINNLIINLIQNESNSSTNSTSSRD